MRSIGLILLSIILVSCESPGDLETPKTSHNYPGATSSTPNGKWASSRFPLELVITDSFSDDELTLIEDMVTEWEDATEGDLDFFNVTDNIKSNLEHVDIGDYYDNEMGIYKHTTWFDAIGSSTLAVTQFFGYMANTDSNPYVDLRHADIIMNYRDFEFSTTGEFGKYDLPSVLLHEIGHFIGLRHETDFTEPSVMHPSLGMGAQKRSVLDRDKQVLLENYSLVQKAAIAGTGFVVGAASGSKKWKEGEFVKGIIELNANGKCVHKIDGKVVHVH